MSDRGRTVVDGLHSTEPNCSDRIGQYGKKETDLNGDEQNGTVRYI